MKLGYITLGLVLLSSTIAVAAPASADHGPQCDSPDPTINEVCEEIRHPPTVDAGAEDCSFRGSGGVLVAVSVGGTGASSPCVPTECNVDAEGPTYGYDCLGFSQSCYIDTQINVRC